MVVTYKLNSFAPLWTPFIVKKKIQTCQEFDVWDKNNDNKNLKSLGQ